MDKADFGLPLLDLVYKAYVEDLHLILVVQNYFKNNFLRKENDINIITKKTKNFFVDQNESFFYGINPLISKISIGGVLFYGFGACESINGILGLRLSKEIKNIELFSLYDNKKNISPHTILKLSKDNIIYFIDIWDQMQKFFKLRML